MGRFFCLKLDHLIVYSIHESAWMLTYPMIISLTFCFVTSHTSAESTLSRSQIYRLCSSHNVRSCKMSYTRPLFIVLCVISLGVRDCTTYRLYEGISRSSYKAAVFDKAPRSQLKSVLPLSRQEALHYINTNLDLFGKQVDTAKAQVMRVVIDTHHHWTCTHRHRCCHCHRRRRCHHRRRHITWFIVWPVAINMQVIPPWWICSVRY